MMQGGADLVIGESKAFQAVIAELKPHARTAWPLLLRGETGTGKEAVARWLHNQGPRAKKPFVHVNCAALGSTLADDDLFGHAKGAFTGSTGERKGRIRSASTGTLFLDEFGDIPPLAQVKLLTVLESRKVRPEGSDDEYDVDVRFIAATSVDIEARCKEGLLRRDLLHRFVSSIFLPPLRKRREDIGLLAQTLLHSVRSQDGANSAAEGFTARSLAALSERDWPGNVRELEHAIKNALVRTYDLRKKVLDIDDFNLPPETRLDLQERDAARASIRGLAASILDDLEWRDSRGTQAPPPETIEAIAHRYEELSLLFSIADIFNERFRGKVADDKARRFFGYTSAESVRSICRRRQSRS